MTRSAFVVHHSRVRTLLWLLLVPLLIPSQAEATLVERDLVTEQGSVVYPGAVTYDTDSGLEWLDLSESSGYSYGQIEAGAGGFIVRGFRHATEDEVATLMFRFGFPSPPAHPTFDDAAHFLTLLSCTSTCGVDGRGSNGIAERVPFSPDSKAIFNLFTFIDPRPAHASLTRFDVSAEHFGPTIGHFLVRVPEPGIAALLACVALGAATRRTVRQ